MIKIITTLGTLGWKGSFSDKGKCGKIGHSVMDTKHICPKKESKARICVLYTSTQHCNGGLSNTEK
jgi:hypothetical protein